MIDPNFWHWISGLMAIGPLWIMRNSPMPNDEVKFVYCCLAIAVPILANMLNELRDEFHDFLTWLPYPRAAKADGWDIIRSIPIAVLCCVVWWFLV